MNFDNEALFSLVNNNITNISKNLSTKRKTVTSFPVFKRTQEKLENLQRTSLRILKCSHFPIEKFKFDFPKKT